MAIQSTKKYCNNELQHRIADATQLLARAHECLETGDFLQAAVRLQELEKFGEFTELEMSIFDVESGA